MKQFRFTLESVLKFRAEMEEKAERAYAHALKVLEAANERVAAEQANLQECWRKSREAVANGAQVWSLEHSRSYAVTLQERIVRLERDRAAAARASEEALRVLLHARQQREILEKLRDKRKILYFSEVQHNDQRQIDDRSSAVYSQQVARKALQA